MQATLCHCASCQFIKWRKSYKIYQPVKNNLVTWSRSPQSTKQWFCLRFMDGKIDGHGRAKILTDSELMQLFIYTPQPYKTVFAVCLYTGCRISEALALKKKYITDSIILFPKGITKGNRP